ncbi:MAG: DUF2304 domain-containing protein [Xanthomonadales bacterium]|nr:DUF2304 domain-containing protein [Xanthomonadales bacterium]MBX3701685.1 DUF2304 domain-containing protein [Dokdonella sp.]MCW5577749.1 DUF2304 domain-containing protein [Dokdonella sp.]MDL1870388.1 DUF2304 domain-containing protein [Gammaproteobacteria bacterium PRO6]
MTGQITSAILGIAIAGAILFLVRRDHLHGPYALWWLSVAAATFVLGVFPGTVGWLGRVSGISYAPVLPIIVAVALILLRLLKLDIDRSRQERRVRRLTQKLAILERELARLGGTPVPDDDGDDS